MTGRPNKGLVAHVRGETFRARRPSHRALLSGPDLPWPVFALLQKRYREATSEPERRAAALEVERTMRRAHETAREADDGGPAAISLAGELAALGKPRSNAALAAFFPRFLAHPKGGLRGQPFRLEPWQRAFLSEFNRRDKKGRRVYRSAVLGLPRGNGKTPLAAGLGLHELVTRTDAPEVYFAAGSREQAGICYEFARSFVETGPLADFVEPKSGGLFCPETGGVLKVVSSDGRLQHGRAASAAVIDEFWAFENKHEQQLYTALASSLHKRADSYLLSITTAGYNKHSLLGQIYDAAHDWPDVETRKDGCLTIARDVDGGQLLWWYAAPDGADLEDPRILRAVNPASWLDLRDLERQIADAGLGEAEARRLHLNQWVSARDAWLPHGLWASLRADITLPEQTPIWVGVDVGLYHDTTAVSSAHLLEDGRIALHAHVWGPNPKTIAHTHFADGKVKLEQVEQFIRELGSRYRIREIAYDPRFFDRSAELLGRSYTLVEYSPSTPPIADATQRFYQLATEHKLAHDGDPVFAAHIDATAARPTNRGWRIYKLDNTKANDACIAAILATSRAHHAQHQPQPDIRWMPW